MRGSLTSCIPIQARKNTEANVYNASVALTHSVAAVFARPLPAAMGGPRQGTPVVVLDSPPQARCQARPVANRNARARTCLRPTGRFQAECNWGRALGSVSSVFHPHARTH